VQPGKCWHLFPRHKFNEFDEFQLPEIVRTPLEQLCLQVGFQAFTTAIGYLVCELISSLQLLLLLLLLLLPMQVRALHLARVGSGGIGEFLKKAPTPPSDTALNNAVYLLLHIGTSIFEPLSVDTLI